MEGEKVGMEAKVDGGWMVEAAGGKWNAESGRSESEVRSGGWEAGGTGRIKYYWGLYIWPSP